MGIFNHINTASNDNTKTNIKPSFITAYYKKSKHHSPVFLNDLSSYQIIPHDCRLTEISCYFYNLLLDFRITLNVRSSGKQSNNELLNSSQNARRQNFSINIILSKNDILWIEIYKQGTRKQIKQDEAVFTFVFSI